MTTKQKAMALLVFFALLVIIVLAGKSWALEDCNCPGEYRISRGEYADIIVYKVEVCSWFLTTGPDGTTLYAWHNAHDTRFPKSIGKEYFDNYISAKVFLTLLKSQTKNDLAKQKHDLKMENLEWKPVK